MEVWSVVNEKGGVGKTTTALTVAGIAASRGQRVVLIDLDPHASLTSFFRIDPDTCERSSFNLFANAGELNDFSLRQSLTATKHENLKLIAASSALASIDRKAEGADGMGRVVETACAHLRGAADLIIIDGPPMAGLLLVNALLAADRLIIPVQTEFFALQGLARMMKTIERLKRADPNFKPDHLIVPTMYDRRTHAAKVSLDTLRADYAEAVWDGQIALDTKFRESAARGVLPHQLAEECFGASAYGMLLDDLLHRPVPQNNERSRA